MSTLKHSINILFISILLFISALSYHPMFVNLADNSAGSIFSSYIIGMTIILFLINTNKTWFNSKYLILSSVFFLFAVLIGLIIMGLYESYYNHDIRNISIAIAITYIGYNLNLTIKNILSISVIYYLTILVVTWAQVRTNIGGFLILDQYAAFAKNSLGVLSSVAAIGSFIIALSINSISKKFILLFGTVVLFALILTIRARASSVAVFLICTIYLYRRFALYNKKIFFAFTIIIILTTILFLNGNLHFIYDYIHDSFTQHNENDITNERIGRGLIAWNMFIDNPLLGILDNKPIPLAYTYVHNYFLRILTYYGILGSFFLFLIYLYQSIYIIKKCLEKNATDIEYMGFWIMLSLLFSSLVEPTFPYGPGTAVLGAYLSLGFSLKLVERKKLLNN